MTVGLGVPHDAANLHVTGQAQYIDDIPVPENTLHLAFGLSEIAYGEIISMDLSAVINSPGVEQIIKASDIPFLNDVSPSIGDEPLLSEGFVFYVGQPIFLVVAKTHLEARKAARKAKIIYNKMKPILTIEEALQENSRFEEGPRIYEKGNVFT